MDTNELKGLWTTRPIRPQAGRTISGVCAGIGNRYRVDPTLVKVAFVVAAMFGGSGILAYIAAILVLPSERRLSGSAAQAAVSQWYADHSHLGYDQWRREHPDIALPTFDGLARHGLKRGHVIGLIILGVIAASSFGPDSRWSSSGLVGVALLAVGWWLLHRRTPVPPPGTSVDTYQQALTAAMSAAPTAAPSRVVPGNGTGTATGGVVVDLSKTTAGPPPVANPIATQSIPPTFREPAQPAWDPLGTARFAWDLPEPTPRGEVTTRTRRRSPLTMITVGVAVLTATGASAAALAGIEWFSPARIVSLALAVLGVGLVFSGLRRTTGRKAYGLIPLAGLAVVAVVVLSAAPHVSLPPGGVGERVWKPTSETEIAASYSLSVGSQTLDLRSVTLTKDRTVDVRTGVGEIVVLVPESMAVESNCVAAAGSVQCPAGRSGPSDSPVLKLTAHTNMGEVRLTRE